jgi:hypothetical protein
MRPVNPLFSMAAQVAVELPSRRTSYDSLANALHTSGEKLSARWDAKADSPRARAVVSHIIGIERWAQRRLRVALGESFRDEEYDGYRPSRDTSWSDLKAQFRETRAESVALARQLAAQPEYAGKIHHNDWGALTPRGWLRYMLMHADAEAYKVL